MSQEGIQCLAPSDKQDVSQANPSSGGDTSPAFGL